MWHDPLLKDCIRSTFKEEEGKECSFIIWLQSERLHGLETKQGGNKKSPTICTVKYRNLGGVPWHMESRAVVLILATH